MEICVVPSWRTTAAIVRPLGEKASTIPPEANESPGEGLKENRTTGGTAARDLSRSLARNAQATSAATAAATARKRQVMPRDGEETGAREPEFSPTHLSARSTSAALCQRSSGF